MTRKAPPGAVVADTPDDIEARFYQALQRGDIAQLMAVWADDDEIVCVHPGGTRAIGPAAIRALFESIFAAGGGVAVRPEQVHRLQQIGCALHHLVERLEGQPAGAQGRSKEGQTPARNQAEAGVVVASPVCLLATNVYLKTAAGWRLCGHHASPGQPGALVGTPGAGPRGAGGGLAGDAPATLH